MIMQEIVRKDILEVLNRLAGILKVKEEKDAAEIGELSNHVIHNASIFQDEDSISTAVLVYSLSKIIGRQQERVNYSKLLGMVLSCISYLRNNQENNFRNSVKKIFEFIRTMDNKLKMYLNEVINHAQLKKGCKLCAHGISVARAAEVLGVSQWELLQYLGETTIEERFGEPMDVSSRLRTARGLFP